MPLEPPAIEERSYEQLVADALARIPVHNPEWTNFNRSDPGVTLIELFAFLTESLSYRIAQIPERNRRRYLSLLGVPLRAAASATGIVAFANERGPAETTVLARGLELRAGEVPFRTEHALDVLPVEGRAFYKRILADPAPELVDYYRQLYASYGGETPESVEPQLYETVPLDDSGVELARETADGSLWIALLARSGDPVEQARAQLAGRTLSLGWVPAVGEPAESLGPTGRGGSEPGARLELQLPRPPAGGLPPDPAARTPAYRTLESSPSTDVLVGPGVVEASLPDKDELRMWEDLDPLELGVGELPPALEDERLTARLVTWLRVRAPGSDSARVLWAGVNAAMVRQRERVAGELVGRGDGEPDQAFRLARTPVLPGSVRLTVQADPPGGEVEAWEEIDDLLAAGPEVPVEDPAAPPGAPAPPRGPAKVFALDPEAGAIRCGDGERGFRPPRDALIRADYDVSRGRGGDVGPGAIGAGPGLPPGFKASNPVRTWGGADAETVAEGEKRVPRYVRHRDRAVSAADFEAIVKRTPGVEVGRVDVLPAYSPELAPNEPGDAAGAVTLMLIPASDPLHPDAPLPDRPFLDAVCRHLDPRRLVGTEVFLRGPAYKALWISIGIEPLESGDAVEVREAVKAQVASFLSPLPPPPAEDGALRRTGWPLRTAVSALELSAVADRVPGVRLVRAVLVAGGASGAVERVEMTGLELPRIAGLSVVAGDPLELERLRGERPAEPPPVSVVPVPVVPESC